MKSILRISRAARLCSALVLAAGAATGCGGGGQSSSAPAAADEAIISMVRDYKQNVDVILGDDGLLTAASKDKTIIVMSTLDPDSMDELGKKVEEESDFRLISAAASGGHSGAEARTLSIMTSGAEETVKSFTPYFDAMGSHVFFYGEKPGNSQVANS